MTKQQGVNVHNPASDYVSFSDNITDYRAQCHPLRFLTVTIEQTPTPTHTFLFYQGFH